MPRKAKETTEQVTLRLPKDTVAFFKGLAAKGLLGSTLDDVVAHVLRQHYYEIAMAYIRTK